MTMRCAILIVVTILMSACHSKEFTLEPCPVDNRKWPVNYYTITGGSRKPEMVTIIGGSCETKKR